MKMPMMIAASGAKIFLIENGSSMLAADEACADMQTLLPINHIPLQKPG
jgi:hypothetical protein